MLTFSFVSKMVVDAEKYTITLVATLLLKDCHF